MNKNIFWILGSHILWRGRYRFEFSLDHWNELLIGLRFDLSPSDEVEVVGAV